MYLKCSRYPNHNTFTYTSMSQGQRWYESSCWKQFKSTPGVMPKQCKPAFDFSKVLRSLCELSSNPMHWKQPESALQILDAQRLTKPIQSRKNQDSKNRRKPKIRFCFRQKIEEKKYNSYMSERGRENSTTHTRSVRMPWNQIYHGQIVRETTPPTWRGHGGATLENISVCIGYWAAKLGNWTWTRWWTASKTGVLLADSLRWWSKVSQKEINNSLWLIYEGWRRGWSNAALVIITYTVNCHFYIIRVKKKN